MRRLALVALVACGGAPAVPTGPKLEPGTQRVVVGDGAEVVIDVRGKGPPCLAHPGGPGLDASYLLGSPLEQHFTVVYIDPLGTGSSTKLAEPELYSIDRDVGVIESLRSKLGFDKLCLIGHSYGGFVVQSYAVAHPDRVRGLFLYSTSPTTEPEWLSDTLANLEWFEGRPWFADASKAIAEEDKAADEAALNALLVRELKLFFADYDGRRADFDDTIRKVRVSFPVARRRPQGKQGRYDVRGKLGRLHTTPTWIVTGEKDFSGGPVPSKWIQQSIADSRLVVIPGAGHFAHVEQPAAFEAAVAQFAAALR